MFRPDSMTSGVFASTYLLEFSHMNKTDVVVNTIKLQLVQYKNIKF
jgi:hypothetical protein